MGDYGDHAAYCAAFAPRRERGIGLAATPCVVGAAPARCAGCGLIAPLHQDHRSENMGNKIVTEADRKATPRPPAPKGMTLTTRRGQRVSLERGTHTRSKKNPGKRAGKGGS
jgi:hypothetical protein